MPDDPSAAAKPAPFWKIAVGAASFAFVVGIIVLVGDMFSGSNPDNQNWGNLIFPVIMLLAGGILFGNISRRQPWLISLFLIVPNPMVLIMLIYVAINGLGEKSALIMLGALVAAPLIGVALALSRPQLRR